MKTIIFKLLPLMVVLAMASCKKDDPTTTELLIDSDGWILVAMTVDPPIVDPISGTSITDFYAQMDACDKDDITIFQDNGTYITDEGATKCDPNDPQTETGTWALSADEKTITIDGESWTIESLTKSSMRVTFPFNEPYTGITYTMTATLEHP
ncbi:MAG: hypothetical protein CMN32_04565 [Saprospirales bacterium]|nr:hypothetical protein [Saprospirales bacterium]